MEKLKTERLIFIFDECHRSQSGETHKRITSFFHNIQFFSFTGTPIFAENASKNDLGKCTTIKYYEILQRKNKTGKHNLKIATIFSYVANEEDADANGFIPEEVSMVEEPRALYGIQQDKRERLDEFINDYNKIV